MLQSASCWLIQEAPKPMFHIVRISDFIHLLACLNQNLTALFHLTVFLLRGDGYDNVEQLYCLDKTMSMH